MLKNTRSYSKRWLKSLRISKFFYYKYSEEIKDMVEFDLADIDDLYEGDVGKWFEEVVNSAGVGFENQL